MFEKWKTVLTNWINCYFNNEDKDDLSVSIETLVEIISHLRENFNLDESKSSLLEAHTVDDFITEKYPYFKFENGHTIPETDQDVYLATSLLLFFVCVNSKNVHIKSAMCKNLGVEDQETILKFSKCLMSCTHITYEDVMAAIKDSCSPNTSVPSPQQIVSETPPALRSLHSEVRRLQAALDAERFDRNYLQDELSRANMKLEKLVKDKEQYKLEVLNLKAKISLCCGENKESKAQEPTSDQSTLKLSKQLEEAEERLICVKEQMEDLEHERDVLKKKLEETKRQNDELLNLCQQETNRASELAEELRIEKNQTQSLRELISELQQHNRLNGLDTSQFECDDVEVSMHTAHNASISSEPCANVIEVQLGEERAKIIVLQKQIQDLEENLNVLNKKYEDEKHALTNTLKEKDNEIEYLKQKVNEEIEIKNSHKLQFDNEINKLSSNFNDIDLKLKETNKIVEIKMREIQTLQEEKLSLLDSFNQETNKLENVIRNLQGDIEAEKASKFKMREEYESQIMLLNDKALNRNNELFELQDKIVKNGEMIESLQHELRKEKEAKDDLSNKHNNDIINLSMQKMALEQDLQQKTELLRDIQRQLKECTDFNSELKKQFDHLKNCYSKAEEDLKVLNENKISLINDVKNRDKKIENLEHKMEKAICSLNESQATISTLKSQLQDEIQFKVNLQNKLAQLENTLSEKEKTIIGFESTLKETTKNYNDDKAHLEEVIRQLNAKMKDMELAGENEVKMLKDEINEYVKQVETYKQSIEFEQNEKAELRVKLSALNEEKSDLSTQLNEKIANVQALQEEMQKLSKIVDVNKTVINRLEEFVATKTQMFEDLQNDFNSETSKLAAKLNITEKLLKEFKSHNNSLTEKNKLQIQSLTNEKDSLNQILQANLEKITVLENEKALLVKELNDVNLKKSNLEKEYINKCSMLQSLSSQYTDEILKLKFEVSRLNDVITEKELQITNNCADLKTLEWNICQMQQSHKDEISKKENELKEVTRLSHELKIQKDEFENGYKTECEIKEQAIKGLQQENEQLQYTLEEDNISHEVTIKEKNRVIEDLERNIQKLLQQINSIKQDSDIQIKKWQSARNVFEDTINEKDKELESKTRLIQSLNDELTDKKNLIAKLTEQNNHNLEQITVLNNDIDNLRLTCAHNVQGNDKLKDTLATEKAVRDSLESEKKNLLEENRILVQKTLDDQTNFKVLEAERDSLLNEKAIMLQELLEEKSIRNMIAEEKERMRQEKEQALSEIESVRSIRDTLLREKECLTQQLVDERLSKEMLEQEKCALSERKTELDEKLATEILNRMQIEKQLNKLAQEKELLTDEISKLKTMVNTSENEKSRLYEQIENIILEKDDSHAQKESLKDCIAELNSVKDTLVNQNREIIQEKEMLEKLLSETKEQLDIAKEEKDLLSRQCEEAVQKYLSEVNNTQEEIKIITSDFNNLQSDYKKLQGENELISSVINSSFNSIIDNIVSKNLNELFLDNKINVIKDLEPSEKFNCLVDIAKSLINEISSLKTLETSLKQEIAVLENSETKNKENIKNLEDDVQNLLKSVNEYKTKVNQQSGSIESKTKDVQKLQQENESLHNELTTVRVQLDEKVHSLKDKLIDNENLTDKLKETYECQIDNLNIMVTKLTNYLKDKTVELDSARIEKEKLQANIDESNKAIKSFEEEIRSHKQMQEKLISEFESERLVLKNMITVTESVMEDQKNSLNKVISVHLKTIDTLQEEIKSLKELIELEKNNTVSKLNEKENAFEILFKDLNEVRKEKETLENKLESEMQSFHSKVAQITVEKTNLYEQLENCRKDVVCKDEENHELKIKLDTFEKEHNVTTKELNELRKNLEQQEKLLNEYKQKHEDIMNKVTLIEKEKSSLQVEKEELRQKVKELNDQLGQIALSQSQFSELVNLKTELEKILEQKSLDLNMKESLLKTANIEIKQIREQYETEKLEHTNKCHVLQEEQGKLEEQMHNKEKEIDTLKNNVQSLQQELNSKDIEIQDLEQELNNKDDEIEELNKMISDKDQVISDLNKRLTEEKWSKEKYLSEVKDLDSEVNDLRRRLEDARHDLEVVNILRRENDELVQLVGQRETFAVTSQEKSNKYPNQVEMELRHLHNQVDSNSADTHTSTDSNKTISDLEIILQDKNRTITSLQSDIAYLKSLVGESENKLLDVTKDLELSKENCQQLSNQLKKIVHQKNEEIAELKKQISKMSITENRASQIIKLSAKYQAMIHKRIAELKTNTILKELTNFGNATNCDNDIRRNINAGTITMEDLENFLETTDKHLKRCTEKQIALQKERDRLSEVNRINESEVINMRKFLTELSVTVKTFNSVKEIYSQKLSRVVSVQRTVRREILNLDGHITDATMCKLERGYAAVMQDLSECAMNMERWVERCIGRTISSEKIKQAFSSELDRVSLASSSFQNASLEVQLEELENSFQKLLEEVSRAKSGEGARDAQSVTVMEVRAEYEDKLNRMKAKMKQLYQEQISIFKDRQKEDIAALERELEETRAKLEESSRAYEKHIRSLTTELWNVGEKFLMKKDEAEWLRKTQRSGSLMSLQHVHSSGLVAHPDEPSRPSDSHSLRSLPVNTKEPRGVHMSDEEGEVFDNRYLKELSSTPRREPPGQRLSELRWRNSLCPPHLKSSYPAETQFASTLHEEDIKCMGTMSLGGRSVRKEVGITAYKKPGPPTPSKQAGRLSATDSELRESLRVEAEPTASRKTSTPSRLRALFRTNKNDTTETTTPRSRRLSNIFRKKC